MAPSPNSNDPAGLGGSEPDNAFAKPDQLLWERDFGEAGVWGWDYHWEFDEIYERDSLHSTYLWDPVTGELVTVSEGDSQLFRYEIPIDIADAFVQTGTPQDPVTYWLAIGLDSFEGQVGWKAREWPSQTGATAVWGQGTDPDWTKAEYPSGHPYEGDPIDMAFGLNFGGSVMSIDWGDAPDPLPVTPGQYPTRAASNGAGHLISPAFYLGPSVDADDDGQPHSSAMGDDNDGNDDEDGVEFNGPLIAGRTKQLTVNVTDSLGANGLLNAWIDFDGNGSWLDAGEHVISNHAISDGPNVLTVVVPDAAQAGPTFARFRLSTLGNLQPGGGAPDGEVEDYQVTIEDAPREYDYGDAPDPTYPTLSASGGASHLIVPDVYLGASVDVDVDGQPGPDAQGDDNDGTADEDGVTFTSLLVPGELATADVSASQAGLLSAWIDFNGDGDWGDSSEQVLADEPLVAGLNNLSFPVPAAAVTRDSTFARFRHSTGTGLSFDGSAPDGEVEDYEVQVIERPTLTIDEVDRVETHDGVTNFQFAVTRSHTLNSPSVQYQTADGTATAGTDYTASGLQTLVFTEGGSTTADIDVAVSGDRTVELDETFFVNLLNAVGADIAAPQGLGTIINDDEAMLSINDVSLPEGNAGTTPFVFTVTLDTAVDTGVTVNFETVNRAAQNEHGDGDYQSANGTLDFLGTAGEQQEITVWVNGDITQEGSEHFHVDLSDISASGRAVTFWDDRGQTQILPDELDKNLLTFAFGEILPNGEGETPASVEVDEYLLDLTQGPKNGVYSLQVWDYQNVGLDPDAVEILDMNGEPVTVRHVVRDATVEGTSCSAVVVSLSPGQYRIRVRSQRGTSGPYRLDVRMTEPLALEVSVVDLLAVDITTRRGPSRDH